MTDNPTIFSNRYQILAKIGQGGLAEVFRAQDVALGRLVAVKALRPEYVTDPAFLVRFHREAQSAASLAHPSIVLVYDFGQDQGRPYIVMEYVPGLDLRTMLEQNGALSVKQAVDIIGQVCAGVGHAHRLGLVHGDMKPGNILITPDGRAKVVDFGLARALGESAMDEEGELVWGTPAYFAPEQAAGGQVAPATDVYAIGVILYEALTGQLPFDGDDAEMARKHLYETPAPINKINPRTPPQLARIVDKALQKQPDERFVTADEMARALSDFRLETEQHTGYHAPADVPASHTTADDMGRAPALARPRLDWVGLLMGLIAVIAILGLLPLWANVYRAYFVRAEAPGLPPPTSTPTAAPGQVRVPDVVGMSVEDGRRVMEAAGLRMEVVGQANHPSLPAFFIIEQRIRVGMPVAHGTTVGVVISQGPQLVEVPALIGRSLDEAQAELQTRALVADTRQAWSEQPRGVVVEQDPPAGSPVKAGSVVRLVISSGTQSPVGARFGENILLVAYELPSLTYQPGEVLRVSLTWQALASPGAGYSVFVHLTRLDGSMVAQHDGLPADGQHPTDTWSPGAQVVDTHQLTIPIGTPQGEYWLRVGVYDQGGRLPIADAGQAIAVDDALVLGTIRVE